MPRSSLPSTIATATSTPPVPRAQARRVKRGVVAGYIHEISVRHGDDGAAGHASPAPAAAAAALRPSE